MPLRLVEVTFPADEFDNLSTLLAGVPVVDVWTSRSAEAGAFARILLEAQHTEALSDALVLRFGSRDEFRLISLAVEATLPAVPAAPGPVTGESAEGGPARRRRQRISREELYEDIAQASQLTPVFLATVALSTVVAAVGLIRGDLAIVIGAMVIAPLLGPNVGLSLAATLGDPDLAKRSLKAVGAGIGTAAALSVILGLLLNIDPAAPEIAARTRTDFADVVLALAAGAAGTLAFTSGVPAVVVGVMVAVALLPPLVVAGLLAGSGHGLPAARALILMLTNVTCVNLAAVGTFLVQQVGPRTWWEAKRAQRAARRAVASWVAMLVLLLGLILLGQIGAL